MAFTRVNSNKPVILSTAIIMKRQSRLADFETLNKLGEGSFGTVFKVRRLVDSKTYVMKKISIASMDKRAQQDAVKEAHILDKLEHRYIVKYYESFIEDKTLHIVMEFCERGDLSHLLKKRKGVPLEESQIWKYFIQMCLGLEYLHGQKVLHRDIKSMNFFLTKDDNIRIGDLGVAKILAHTAAFAHTMIGTPYYLSPELCEEKPYNVKSDIWALGCVLYEMCALRHPFEATNQGALILKILRSKYPPLSEVYSAELRQLVGTLLSKDYRKRPAVSHILQKPVIQEYVKMMDIDVPTSSVISPNKNDTVPVCLPISIKKTPSSARMNKNSSFQQVKSKLIKSNAPTVPKLRIKRRTYFPFSKPATSIFLVETVQIAEYEYLDKPIFGILCDESAVLQDEQQRKEDSEEDSYEIEEEIQIEQSDSSQLSEFESYGDIPVLSAPSINIPITYGPDCIPDLVVYRSGKHSSQSSTPDDSFDEIYEEDLFEEEEENDGENGEEEENDGENCEEEEEIKKKLEDNIRNMEIRKVDLTKIHQNKKEQILKRINNKFYELYEFFNNKVKGEIDDDDEEIDYFFSQYSEDDIMDMYHFVHLELEIENIEEELRSAKIALL